MNNKWTKIGGVLIVLLALAALIGSTMTFAQDDPPVAPTAVPDEDSPDAGLLPGMGMRMGMGHGRMGGTHFFNGDDYDAALADELGITVEELTAARLAAKETVLAQLVAEGTITQAQADAILSGEGLRSIGPLMTSEAMHAVIAEALGITVEELTAAQADGQRLTDLAAELGVAIEDVQTAVQEAHDAAVQQALADGLITQEQADWLLERGAMGMHNGMGMQDGMGMQGGMGGHRGGMGGHHGGMGGGFQNAPSPDAPANPQG